MIVDCILRELRSSQFIISIALSRRRPANFPVVRKSRWQDSNLCLVYLLFWLYLNVPTMRDGAMQTSYKFAIEPIAEITADNCSYAYRPRIM